MFYIERCSRNTIIIIIIRFVWLPAECAGAEPKGEEKLGEPHRAHLPKQGE